MDNIIWMTSEVIFLYSAKLSCNVSLGLQVKFAQQYIEGSGKPDGEQCERLWSYLRGFCAVTKEMTQANRNDALTDSILYYGRKSERKLRMLPS